ncbi:formylglycine-generating enzyme family protein [Paraburkholderia acidiphila]|uniref:SUMF1/EgtB/PvdO family nonheme iron enzyme n=1 Tax=Paraburkholderia acidiphila TaxID=2571747 RepID=A0A7Z2G8F1_9BURK|nr:formylglycine-generating enzyme family protein [Paraburkholderia acidiphila]QGZ57118.1 SUMF1/EgtB/PvdO family nonheme iron enzyme [Paraburkholderia acidiphila]
MSDLFGGNLFMQPRLRLLATALSLAASCALADTRYVEVPGGAFRSAIKSSGDSNDTLVVAPFRMRERLVTNAEFLAFVGGASRWRRDRVAALFATPGYLSRWAGPLDPGPDAPPDEPVTGVSWFAARAYCASEQARLPKWIEWEYAAAADEQHRDAREDGARQARLLTNLMMTFGAPHMTPVRQRPNVYGLYGMHTLTGEWVDDYAALFADTDTRNPGNNNELRLCGGAALAFIDRTDYTLMMRVAALSALKPADSSHSVGFRCIKDSDTDNKGGS